MQTASKARVYSSCNSPWHTRTSSQIMLGVRPGSLLHALSPPRPTTPSRAALAVKESFALQRAQLATNLDLPHPNPLILR